MRSHTIFFSFAALFSNLAISNAQSCTADQRLAGAEAIPYAYNLTPLGAAAAAFNQVPFASDCTINIFPNGGPGVPTAVDGKTTVDFAIATRQLFSEVTGEYTDVPETFSTIIHTNVTLGVRNLVPIPVTFYADVYLDYNTDCKIKAVRADATIPTQILGLILHPPSLGLLPII